MVLKYYRHTGKAVVKKSYLRAWNKPESGFFVKVTVRRSLDVGFATDFLSRKHSESVCDVS